MKLFNIDCHISVMADLKQIFENLGHSVTSWSLSKHNWVFGKNANDVDILTADTWLSINSEMCDRFYERYKDELSQYDAFVTAHPPVFSMLYERFHKPIIMQITIRYEVPYHLNKKMWSHFNEYLRHGIDQQMIFPVANSMYDKEYFEFFVQRACGFIPNVCAYTEAEWNPINKQFLYSGRFNLPIDNTIVNRAHLGRYEWKDIFQYKGVIIIPYNCSLMSIFEFYTANMPIFCPSKTFIKHLYRNDSRTVLSELTWNQVFRSPPGSVLNCDRDSDPNHFNNMDIMSEWIDKSDFYNEEWMPFIEYFDSFDDLKWKMNNTDVHLVSERMRAFNKERKEDIYYKWSKQLSLISGLCGMSHSL